MNGKCFALVVFLFIMTNSSDLYSQKIGAIIIGSNNYLVSHNQIRYIIGRLQPLGKMELIVKVWFKLLRQETK